MTEEINEKLKAIKRSFRTVMNGVASHSMREKGVGYKLNWGVSLVHLREMAATYGKDYDLAIALWKEDIRECKILATLIMPAERLLPEVADIWLEQTTSQELAEMLAANLLKDVSYAPEIAYRWMASDNDIRQICGFCILSRLFMRGQEPNERGINEFLDQAVTALLGTSVGVRHAAWNCINRFAELGEDYEAIAQKALQQAGIDFF